MNEVIGSIAKHFDMRMRTPVYGIFGFWWIVFHWEFFYTLLFVDQNKIFVKTGLLKNEYLKQRFYDYSHAYFWRYFILSLLGSLLLTYLMIWVVPRLILISAFDKEQEHIASKREIKLKYEQNIQEQRTKLEKEKTKLEEQAVKKFEASERKVAQIKKVQKTDPSIMWQEEYEQFADSPLYQRFEQLIRSLYEFGGQVKVVNELEYTTQTVFELDRNLLAYADANELIRYDRRQNIIELTEKGKYFVKRYQAHK